VVGVFGRSVLYFLEVFLPFTIAYLLADLVLDLADLRLLFVLGFEADFDCPLWYRYFLSSLVSKFG